MEWFLLFIICILIYIIYIYRNKANETKELNDRIDIENEQLNKQREQLHKQLYELETNISTYKNILKDVQESITVAQDTSKDAFGSYCDVLDTKYENEDAEFDTLIQNLINSYNNKQDELNAEIDEIRAELDDIRATRAAAQQSLIKEKEIKEQLDFYCLSIDKDDLDDINNLERIKSKLHQPRILCMLIWSTYYQKPMTQLCNNILGSNTVIGIYKITNQITNECYVGQSVDIAKRWKDHAKCGLGIDTPAGNKLYAAIEEYGLVNFSFELLEECEKALLDEKEMFYISLYQSNDFGYNSTKGNKKS